MLSYDLTIMAVCDLVRLFADCTHDGRAVQVMDWYWIDAGRTATRSLLALKLPIVERQLAVATGALGSFGISHLRLMGPQDWMSDHDRTTIDDIMACLGAGGIAIRRREDGLPSAGSV